jgi:hypothetical protein
MVHDTFSNSLSWYLAIETWDQNWVHVETNLTRLCKFSIWFNVFHVRALYYTKNFKRNGKFLPEDDPAGSKHVGVCYNWRKKTLCIRWCLKFFPFDVHTHIWICVCVSYFHLCVYLRLIYMCVRARARACTLPLLSFEVCARCCILWSFTSRFTCIYKYVCINIYK